MRTGAYRVTAQLQGFAVVTRSGLELLVGQQAVVNLQLSPSTVRESVTVTGEAPLVTTTPVEPGQQHRSAAASELPVNGRNWLDLTMLAAGSRINTVSSDDLMPKASVGTFAAERRRSSGDVHDFGHRLRSASLRPRLDRRVRVRRKPVRRQPGPVGGRAGQRRSRNRERTRSRVAPRAISAATGGMPATSS